MRLIHYGSNKYIPRKFLTVENSWIKPKGGLWTSPINSKYGWKDWCNYSEFRICDSINSFIINLKRNTRILKINCKNDIKKIPFIDSYIIDFEKLKLNYDCIWLTIKGEQETRFLPINNLYGWDCESVLILNKKCIK